MPYQSAYRSRDPQVLDAFAENLGTLKSVVARIEAVEQASGHRMVTVTHPDGVLPIGIAPQDGIDPGPGWMLDPAMKVLLPDQRTETGRRWVGRMEGLAWHRRPIPGMPGVLPNLRSSGVPTAAVPVLETCDGWLWAMFDAPVHRWEDALVRHGLDLRLWAYMPSSAWPGRLSPSRPGARLGSSRTPVLHGAGS